MVSLASTTSSCGRTAREIYGRKSTHRSVDVCTYLCLSGLTLLARHADLIEEAMQLANDGVDLL